MAQPKFHPKAGVLIDILRLMYAMVPARPCLGRPQPFFYLSFPGPCKQLSRNGLQLLSNVLEQARFGRFKKMSPTDYLEMFLKWQDQCHRVLQIKNVEKEVENLRSGGGARILADAIELAARDVEELLRDGELTLTDRHRRETRRHSEEVVR